MRDTKKWFVGVCVTGGGILAAFSTVQPMQWLGFGLLLLGIHDALMMDRPK